MSTTTTQARKSPVFYIQRRDGRNLETIDEFDTRKEAREMVREYNMADPTAYHYISTRGCKDWLNR